jgi:hypothetical protein
MADHVKNLDWRRGARDASLEHFAADPLLDGTTPTGKVL